MSGTSTMNYDKISKKCCGIKLNHRRFSVQRLRTNFLYIFRVFRRWKNSYRNALRLLRRNLARRRRRSKDHHQRDLVGRINEVGYGYSSSSSSSSGIRTMGHSNSFCSEAIADCLEFIKRNSVSIDDESKPMLKQE